MANYTKSFNFRNGVQVDDDNFIVNSSGLVGIGTSVPTQLLDVNGNINSTGLVNAVNLRLTGISTLAETRVGSGITLDATTGIITAVAFYGNGATLSNLPTSQWVDVDAGLGFTSIYAAGNVGVATNDPRFVFQVGGRPGVGNQTGVGINSTGGVVVSGVVTSYSGFSGPGLGITQLNANYLVVGTISTTILPRIPNSLLSRFIEVGIITATSGFLGNLTGDVSGNTSGNFVNAGIVTASNMFLGNITGAAATITYINAGIVSAVGASGFTAFYGALTGEVYGNVNGNLAGVADTAATLRSGVNITVNNAFTTSIVNQTTLVTGFTSITSDGLQVGTRGNYLTVTSTGVVGIGTSQATTADLQIRKSSPILELIGDSGSATISIGQSVGIGNSVGVLRFGANQGQFDLINRGLGNLNFVLHGGGSGFGTGRFSWTYGQNNFEVASLTYDGKLGLGITNPTSTLHVVGTSTVTGNAFFANDVTVYGTLSANTFNLPSIINANINATTGISTFNKIETTGSIFVGSASSIGIGTTNPRVALDAQGQSAFFGGIGVNTTTVASNSVVVNGGILASSIGIGTTATSAYLGVYGNVDVYPSPVSTGAGVVGVNLYKATIVMDPQSGVGIGTTVQRCVLDFADAGKGIAGQAQSFMIPPRLTTTQRNALTVVAGAFIFNTTTSKFQGYTGVAWTDFH